MLGDDMDTSQPQWSPSLWKRIRGYRMDNHLPPHTNNLNAHRSLQWH